MWGREKFVLFLALPQNILVPPTPATGRRFPLLWLRKKVFKRNYNRNKKNDIFVLFFLTRARDAATPRAVGSAALTGDRLRAETEAAPVQRSSARGGKRCVTRRIVCGSVCVTP